MRSNLPRLLAAACVPAIALSAAPASANVEVGISAGPHSFNQNSELGVEDRDDAESLRNSVFFGGRLGFMFNDMLGIEGEVGAVPSEGRMVVFDVWTLATRAHVIAQFLASKPEQKVIPFVVVGGGAITVIKSGNETQLGKDTDPVFYLGGGAKYRVENGWGLRLDVRGKVGPSSKVKDDGMTSDNAPVFDFEVLLSVYKEFGRDAISKIIKIEKEPEVADADSDGIEDASDGCVDQPEDADGFQDDDGCPDTDNDGDGILDEADECRNDAEGPADGFKDEDGCPDPDNDLDKLLDEADQCKDDAEDMDGFEDDNGCPDPDNDGDGVLDGQDNCPDSLETPNGYQDTDGCSDEVPKAVQKFTGVIKGINFKNNEAVILKSSFKTLDAAVKVLQDYPDVSMEISGHTDDTGKVERNKELSQQRAEAVKQYFVDKGIDASRLTAVGYANEKPLVNKKTKAARAKNRRVEFKLISGTGEAAGGETGSDGEN